MNSSRVCAIVVGLFLAAATVYPQAALPVSGISWASVPAGVFDMGCVPSDARCGDDEYPRHTVTLTRPFELMTTEVTVGMYRAATKDVDQQPVWSTSANHPVVIVTWGESQTFCQGVGGRLPTEAEWEYAARGGRAGAIFPWGDQLPVDTPGVVNGAAFEGDAARPVGSFAPNGYGLYDMAGNVWEWTADGGGLYISEAAVDPMGPATERTKLVRGGSYGDDSANLRVSNRTPNPPGSVNVNVGLRCARDLVR